MNQWSGYVSSSMFTKGYKTNQQSVKLACLYLLPPCISYIYLHYNNIDCKEVSIRQFIVVHAGGLISTYDSNPKKYL